MSVQDVLRLFQIGGGRHRLREALVLEAKFLREDLPYFTELLSEVISETKYTSKCIVGDIKSPNSDQFLSSPRVPRGSRALPPPPAEAARCRVRARSRLGTRRRIPQGPWSTGLPF